jgi:hypothetical protein
MDEMLRVVLEACASKRVIANRRAPDVSLISLRDFDSRQEPAIQKLLDFADETLGVRLFVVGGGFGCAKINFGVEAEEESDRAWKLWRLLQDEEFHLKAREGEFRVLLTHDPDARLDLSTGDTEGLHKRRGVPLFCSYAHADRELQKKLRKHLAALEWMGLVSYWHDGEIPPGEEFDSEIHLRLRDAEIILFLVSADLFASQYIREKEIPVALVRHRRREATTVPVVIRPADWTFTPLGKLKALPLDGKAVTEWENQDSAFADIAENVRKMAVSRIRQREPLPFSRRDDGDDHA